MSLRPHHQYEGCSRAEVLQSVLVDRPENGGVSLWRGPDGATIVRTERTIGIDHTRWGYQSDDAEFDRIVVTWRKLAAPAGA